MKKEQNLKSKRAIIVGASSGIGKEMALYFANQGWDIAALGRRKKLIDEYCLNNKSISSYEIDIIDVETLSVKLQRIVDDLGGLDLFVISAGVGFINYELDFLKNKKPFKQMLKVLQDLFVGVMIFLKEMGTVRLRLSHLLAVY